MIHKINFPKDARFAVVLDSYVDKYFVCKTEVAAINKSDYLTAKGYFNKIVDTKGDEYDIDYRVQPLKLVHIEK